MYEYQFIKRKKFFEIFYKYTYFNSLLKNTEEKGKNIEKLNYLMKQLTLERNGLKDTLELDYKDLFKQQNEIMKIRNSLNNTNYPNDPDEPFTNMSDVKRVVLSDMVLKTVLFASLFFLLTHKDMQPVLKKLVKNLPKSVGKVLHPAVLFGMLYYLLELFI